MRVPTTPTVHEARRAAAVLRRIADLEGADVARTTSADLALTADLRPGVDSGRLLTALAAAGALRAERIGASPCEVPLTVAVWPGPDGGADVREARWQAARDLTRALGRSASWADGGWVPVRPAEYGLERYEAERGVALLAGFGCLEARPHPADGRLPLVRRGPRPLAVLAAPGRLRAEGVDAVLAAAGGSGGRVDLAGVAAARGWDPAVLLDALRAAHLLGLLRLDPQSWRREPVTVARVTLAPALLEVAAALAPADLGTPAAGDAEAAADLNDAQRRAVADPSARLAVVAGPGTGKTRTLTRRIAHRIATGRVRAEGVVAVTFTTDAAQQMQVRLAALGVRGVRVGTLNALGHRLVRDHFRAAGFARPPEAVSAPRQIGLVRDLVAVDRDAADLDPVAVHTAILRAKAEMWDPDGLAAAEPPFRCPEPRAAVARVWRAYQETLRAHDAVDFTDQIALAVRVLADDAAARRVRGVVDEVFVDEFQDLSPLQIRLVTRLAEGRGLTVVGDPRQAIYEWNGARPEQLGRLAGRPEFTRVELEVNYRSTEPILRAANTLMDGQGFRPVRPPGTAHGPWVGLRRTGGQDAAADAVVRLVEGHRARGLPDDEIAVLVRLNDELRTLTRGMRAAGIAVQASDLVGLHQTAAYRLARRTLTPERVAAAGSLSAAMDALREGGALTALAGAGDDPGDAVADWDRLTAALAEHDRLGARDPVRALDAVAREERDEDRAPAAGGVVLTTMHRAKGREWDAVVVAVLDVRAFESRQPEERRVAYVALTRARRHLDVVIVGADRYLLQEAGITPPASVPASSRGPRRRARGR